MMKQSSSDKPDKQDLITQWIMDHAERLLIGLTAFTVGFALLFLAMWIVTNLFWAAEDAEMRSVETANSELQVDFPNVVLANDRPVTFTFTIRNVISPVVISAPIPLGLRQVAPASEAAPPTMTLSITPTSIGVGSGSAVFINSKARQGIRPETCMDITGSAPVTSTIKACFLVEGIWGQVSRSFISIAVTDKSPLIALIVTFITGSGALLPGLLKQQAEQRKKAEEAEKQQRKDKAAQMLQAFRRHLIEREADAAQNDLKALEDLELAEWVEAELPLMRNLVQLANASTETDLIALVKQTAAWPDECTAAYLSAFQRLYSLKLNVLREAMIFIPRYDVSDHLRAELLRAARDFPEVQSPTWPVFRKFAVPDTGGPFLFEQAESEQAALFGAPNNDRRPMFWANHSLLAALQNAKYPQLVFGVMGSGRTAMGLALGKYAIAHSLRFSMYLPGQPTSDDIAVGYGHLLLDFVRFNPAHLSKLGSPDRRLLARLLTYGPSRDDVLGEVEDIRRSSEWQSLGDVQLDLLMTEIEHLSPDRLSEAQWPWAVNRCARALGFEQKQITLVIDSAATDPSWLTSFIAPRMVAWWQAGLIAIVFAPKVILDNGFTIEDGVTQVHTLTWTPDEFETMLRYRYRSVLGSLHHIDHAFEPESLFAEMMSQSRYNLLMFIHLWNECRRETGGAKINTAALTTVLGRENIK